VAVSTFRDLAAAQSAGADVAGFILELNHEIVSDILGGKVMPASKRRVFLQFDPFAPQIAEAETADLCKALLQNGFIKWVANNPAHFSMLKSAAIETHKKPFIIAGSYLYTFYRWAASTLENMGAAAFIPPYENSRENLAACFEKKVRSRVLVPIFAYPVLFRMRGLLPESYDFSYFLDKEGMMFKSMSTVDGSYVLPENPFSIVDMTAKLQSAGFSRFLIDLTKTAVDKKDFRAILLAARKGAALPETSRFNWKDGFWTDKTNTSPPPPRLGKTLPGKKREPLPAGLCTLSFRGCPGRGGLRRFLNAP
jgi:putative protease